MLNPTHHLLTKDSILLVIDLKGIVIDSFDSNKTHVFIVESEEELPEGEWRCVNKSKRTRIYNETIPCRIIGIDKETAKSRNVADVPKRLVFVSNK